jgi:hypothetical protein
MLKSRKTLIKIARISAVDPDPVSASVSGLDPDSMGSRIQEGKNDSQK